jgi:deazaflavin-dependent oxidoreductase (nitroreductase family)
VPKLTRVAAAVAGAAVAAAIAFPPSRRQSVRVARAVVDELAMRSESGLAGRLVLLTTEGASSGIPRTVVLTAVDLEDDTFVLPWLARPHWLCNVLANPEVVVDDRTSVHRARAEVLDGEVAQRVRRAALAGLPLALASVIDASGVILPRSTPAVRLTPR